MDVDAPTALSPDAEAIALARIERFFKDSIQTKEQAMTTLMQPLYLAGMRLVHCIRGGRKILACGNGGSAGDAQHFSAECLNRFERERPSIPAIALTTDSSTLTAIANDYAYEDIFAKQIEGLGQVGDVLVAFTTSGQSLNILRAMKVAHTKGLSVIALTGKDGGDVARHLADTDIEIRVPATSTPRIQEVHLLALHCLCDFMDEQLYGTQS